MSDARAPRPDISQHVYAIARACRLYDASVYDTDRGFEASTQNNLRENQRAAIVGVHGPLDQNQQRPEISAELMSALELPGIEAAVGLPKPLSTDEFKAIIGQDAYANPEFGPGMQRGVGLNVAGDFNVETILDENGVARLAPRGDAVGREAFVNPGSEAAPKAVVLVDKQTGERFSGAFRNGQYYLGDGATPADPARFEAHNLPSVTGAADDVGFGAIEQRHANSQFRATTVGLELLDETLDRLRANPAALGFPGALTRLGQNALQTVDAVAQQFGGRTPTSEDLVAAGLIDREMYDQFFNPALPEIDVLINQLVWSYAQAQQGDRISNQQLQEARASLGVDGILATSRGAEQALNLLRERFERDQRSAAVNASPRIVGAYDPAVRRPGGAPPPAAQDAPAGGTTSTNIPFRILD